MTPDRLKHLQGLTSDLHPTEILVVMDLADMQSAVLANDREVNLNDATKLLAMSMNLSQQFLQMQLAMLRKVEMDEGSDDDPPPPSRPKIWTPGAGS